MNHLEIIAKQSRHSMFNVARRSLLINIFNVESNKYYIFSVCVCSLSYQACKAHAPYCRLWPVRLYNTFPPYHLTGTIRKKKSLELKYLFWFSLQIFLNYLSFLEEMSGTWSKLYTGPQAKWPLLLSDFDETRNFSTDFRKIFKYQISWMSVQWELFHADGQAWWS